MIGNSRENSRAPHNQTSSLIRILCAGLVLAVCYFGAGYIGRSLAVPPGYATIIWPASGVALCALIAFGGRLWPGIWLGSFAFNVASSYDSVAGFDQAWHVYLVAAGIGIGASMQAVFALRMTKAFSEGIELTNAPRVSRALLLVVLLPCLIAPTIGVATLFAAEVLTVEQVRENWLTWYYGDLLGVSLIMPILLLTSWSPIVVTWRGRPLTGLSALVAMSLLSTLMLTLYAWQFVSEREYTQAKTSFETIADSTEDALRHRLQTYERALEGAAAFAAVDGDISSAEWRGYVDRMDLARAYPGMRGIGMFERVRDPDFPAFRKEFASEVGELFAIHPQVNRADHFIINRVEPLATNHAALGLNLAFEKERRAAIALSTRRPVPVLTRPIVLVQDRKQGAGFLLLHSIRDAAGRPTKRWTYAPIVAEELFNSLIPQQGTDFALEVRHGDTHGSDTSLYASQEISAYPKFEARRKIELGGQPFSLRLTELPKFANRHRSSGPVVTVISGLTITVLLAFLLVIFLRREGHIVTEVKAATAELAERNRMLKLAEATAHIGHWHLNIATGQVAWSDEVYRLHGLDVGDLPELARAIAFYHPEDRSIVEKSLETAVATRSPYSLNARLITKDGKTRYVEVRGQVDVDEQGLPKAIIGVIIDRTNETIMRERLTQSIEEARAADTAKSTFLVNMSHEIRTPMNGVIGFTELALAEESDPAQRRRLQMIADSSNAMLRLLNDLLDLAKIEARQMAIVSEPVDLRHILRSCQRLMEPVANNKGLKLDIEIDPGVPPIILVDSMRLRQITLNLLGNALKFTGKGEVKLSAAVVQGCIEDAAKLEITVKDTGIGIPGDRLGTIFEKFTQADDTTARRYGGTGLGLPISSELAELMGGDLRVESELGEGSAFTVSLPLKKAVDPTFPEKAPEIAGNCGGGARLRILVAEDNPINQELTMAMVDKAGHACELARDGVEAVAAVLAAKDTDRPFDLILMDMQMPNMDGLQATRTIREAGIDGDTLPILAVTANAYADDIQRCLAAGMQAHLAKPLRFKELCSAIIELSDERPEENEVPPEGFEEKGDPRLRAMFEERVAAASDMIDRALHGEKMTKRGNAEIASLLHQIAGVAAYFHQEELGKFCKSMERKLVETASGSMMPVYIEIRSRINKIV
ncbi:CHASE domain-containing protein [Sphingomonas sp.]|jgi:PAS domain S-box-containing protein|uniref:CHASE domain-containing protein n=1 Tax=Sphingomonas sp. TaxID=28214 RepID=UPI002E11FE11|nr:CHASE domain-containing protein [Sphingomonas sp.]